MSDEKFGGIALISSAIGLILTMALHPTGHDLVEPSRYAHQAFLARLVHGLAVACLPASFVGTLALSRRLASARPLSIVALVVHGFALVAAMTAAVVSGFVVPSLVGEFIASEGTQREEWNKLLEFNHWINQSFAAVYVVASSFAILLWSIAVLATRTFGRGLGIFGCVIAPAIVCGFLSGRLELDVHGFGIIVLGQSLWFIAAGVGLRRSRLA